MTTANDPISLTGLIRPLTCSQFLLGHWNKQVTVSSMSQGYSEFVDPLKLTDMSTLLTMVFKNFDSTIRVRSFGLWRGQFQESESVPMEALSLFKKGEVCVLVENIHRLFPAVTEILGKISNDLVTPIDRSSADVVAVPGRLRTLLPQRKSHDFWILLDGQFVWTTEKFNCEITGGGTAIYVPPGVSSEIHASQNTFFLRMSFQEKSALNLLFDHLKKAAEKDEKWQRNLSAAFDSTIGRDQATRELASLAEDLSKIFKTLDWVNVLETAKAQENIDRLSSNKDWYWKSEPSQWAVTSSLDRQDYYVEVTSNNGTQKIRFDRRFHRLFNFIIQCSGPFDSETAFNSLGPVGVSKETVQNLLDVLASTNILFSKKSPKALQRTKLPEYQNYTRPDDIFVASYPKSGTTWLQMIMYQLSNRGDGHFDHIYQVSPYFEKELRLLGNDRLKSLPSPRILKTHLSPDCFAMDQCKYVYVARDGMDVAVSYYHHCKEVEDYNGEFNDFFAQFLNGSVPAGSWFEHVKVWWEYRENKNVLFLTYADLKSNLRGSVERIAAFCGFKTTPAQLDEIIPRLSFSYMKSVEHKFDPHQGLNWIRKQKATFGFLRKGEAGEGKKNLTPLERETFKKEQDRLLDFTLSEVLGHGTLNSLEA